MASEIWVKVKNPAYERRGGAVEVLSRAGTQ
jgi:hypothetical protein